MGLLYRSTPSIREESFLYIFEAMEPRGKYICVILPLIDPVLFRHEGF